MADSSLEAKFGIDDSEFQAGMRKLISSISELAGKFDQFGEQAGKGFGKAKEGSNMLMDSIKDLLPAISAAFVVDKVMDFGAKCMEAATKADTAFRKLQFSTEKIGGATPAVFKALIDWTDSYAKSLNMLYTPEELQGAEAQLSTFGLTTEQIKSLLPQIVDLAQATGTDLNSAVSMATQAIMGHGRALKQVGISIGDTGSKTENLAMLQQKLGKFTGEAASQLDSFANKDKEMDNQMEETEKSIGDKLIPIWQGLKKNVLETIDAMLHFKSTQDSINDSATNQIDKLTQGKNETQLWTMAQEALNLAMKNEGNQQVHDAEIAAYDHIIAKIKQVREEQAAAKTNTEQDFKKKGEDKTHETEPKVPTDKIKDFSDIVKAAQAEANNLGETKFTVMKTELEGAKESLKKFGEAAITSGKAVDGLKKGIEGIKTEQAGMVQQMELFMSLSGDDIVTRPATAIEKLNDAIKEATDHAKEFGETRLDTIKSEMEAVKKLAEEAFKTGDTSGLDTYKKKLADLTVTEKEAEEAAKDQAGSQKLLASTIGDTAKGVGDAIGSMAAGEKTNPLAALMSSLAGAIASYGGVLITAGTTMLVASDPGGVAKIAEGTGLEAIAGTIKALAAKKFASGGIVSGSTFANIGEYAGASHNPEVVAPLDKLRGMLGNNNNGGGHYSFELMGDKMVTAMNRQANNNNFVLGTNNQ